MTATTAASDDYVIKCYPPPTPSPDGGSAFRGNLLRLLEALPTAAAPTGFASLKTTGMAASDRASVRGLCSKDSAPEPCRRCLADAAKRMAEQCGDASRHARYWDERCLVVYTDGANSSASAHDDFGAVCFSDDAVPRPDVVSVMRLVALAQSLAQRAEKNYGSMVAADATIPASKGDATTGHRTVLVGAKCERHRGAPDCARCLREASLAMARSWEAGGDAQGRFTWVRGSNCFLLFEISTPPPTLGEKIWIYCVAFMKGVVIGVLIGLVILALMDVHDRMRMKARNNENAPAAVKAMSGIMTMK
ncbi:unnamed protein product [Alopecurus aequalis]